MKETIHISKKIKYSSNKLFKLQYNYTGFIIFDSNDNELFYKEVKKLYTCDINDLGFIIFTEIISLNDLKDKVFVIDITGNQIASVEVEALVETVTIGDDLRYYAFSTNHSKTEDGDSIFVIDLLEKKIALHYKKVPVFSVKSLTINNEKRILNVKTITDSIKEIEF